MKDEVTLLGEGRFVKLLKRSDGWEYAERVGTTGASVIAGFTLEKKIVLVEQFRPPLKSNVIELPAGLVGDEVKYGADESMRSAALRELHEETGYEAGDLIYLIDGPCSPGLTNETFTLFLAKNIKKTGPGGGVGDEKIIVHEVSVESIDEWFMEQLKRGCIIDPKIYLALYFYNKSEKDTK